ncbi:MAG: hypothetical protein AAB734_04420 [Patescibacteria group bacterium]
MLEIIPTVVPQSLDDILAAKKRYGAFSPVLHIDASDGVFAPNKTWLPLSGEKLPDSAAFTYEAHLMITNPLSIGVAFARAGAARVIGHIEAFNNAECAQEAFDMWQKAGAQEVGVAVLLQTPLDDLAPYMQLCDFVHMMTIANIGKQGYAFDASSIERVKTVHERYPHITISTDGGESRDVVDDLARAGATRFCIGTALAKAKDPEKTYSQLLKAATSELGHRMS